MTSGSSPPTLLARPTVAISAFTTARARRPRRLRSQPAVSTTTAILNGSVIPNGSATTYYFQYGATTAYGTHIPHPGKRWVGHERRHRVGERDGAQPEHDL